MWWAKLRWGLLTYEIADQENSHEPQDEKRVCFYYDTKGSCRRGDNCRYEHVRTGGMITTDKQAVFCAYDTSHTITSPAQGSWVAVEVSNIHTPAHFYVIFPFGTKPILQLMKEEELKASDEGYEGSNSSILDSIDALMESMNDEYNRVIHRDVNYTVYAMAEVVACRFTQDNRWYRARVLIAKPEEHQVRVFYVDFGNSEWVSESQIRQMKPMYMQLPFQAVECFLSVEPACGEEWEKDAKTFFWDLVNGKVLFARIVHSGVNGVLTLDLYDTTDDDVHINQFLIDKGFAKKSDMIIFESEHSSRGDSRREHSSSSSGVSPQRYRMMPG